MRRIALPFLILASAGMALVGANAAAGGAEALRLARQQAEQAGEKAKRLERQAAQATSEAERARAEGEMLAADIETAEAELTAAETRIALIARLQAEQRARLAERQEPVVRLTAALQTITRRPPALALIQPGSIDELVHVRALLASTLPEIRERTASLRAEVARANALRHQADRARDALAQSRTDLAARRTALARFEAGRRAQSENLAGLALAEGDRALAFSEEARALARQVGTRQFQEQLRARLAELPPPLPRPGTPQQPGRDRQQPDYMLPVTGEVLTGVGEISDGGVHARGVTFAVAPGAPVVAPAHGRAIFARPFRDYGRVLILDHGRGWFTVITGLESLSVEEGARVVRGASLGRAGRDEPEVTVELRRAGRPVPFTQFVAG